MKMIVAVSENWGIGKDNNLLFSIPEDMKFFRTTTANSVVIMGRKTLESFPGKKPLKNRINIVLTKDPDYETEARVCTSKEEVMKTLETIENKNVFVIGGESIYRLFEPECDTAYITKVKAGADADTFFINLDESPDWVLSDETEEKEDNGYKFSFCTYTREEKNK